MKYLLFVFIACFFVGGLNAQQEIIKINDRVVLNANSPVVWVDSFRTDMAHLVMDRSDIDSLSIIRDSTVAERYGKIVAKGSVIIYPKDKVELVRLSNLLERQEVKPSDRNLRVCINKTLVRNPSLLLLQPGYIKTIEITTERHWTYPDEANSKELFLNIITKDDQTSRLN